MNLTPDSPFYDFLSQLKNTGAPLYPQVVATVEGDVPYADLYAEYFQEYNPQGPQETMLLTRLVDLRWTIQCCRNQAFAIHKAEANRILGGLLARIPEANWDMVYGAALLTMHPKDCRMIEKLERAESRAHKIKFAPVRELHKVQTERLGHAPILTSWRKHGTTARE